MIFFSFFFIYLILSRPGAESGDLILVFPECFWANTVFCRWFLPIDRVVDCVIRLPWNRKKRRS